MVNVTYLGKKFRFAEYKGGNAMRRLRSGLFYEKHMLDYIRNLEPKGVVFDVGANVGNHTVYLAALTNCEKVIAFEPQPTMYKILIKNIQNNKLNEMVKTYNVAVGDKKSKVGLFWEAPDKLGSTRVIKGDTTQQITLDSVAVKYPNISVIKIDVEGSEVKVLKGAKKILHNQSPILFVEIWSRKQKKEVENILMPYGYKPSKVFNSSATYLYQKDASIKGVKGVSENITFQLSKLRVFRKSS